MIVALLILHGVLALVLIGALTHQGIALWWPARPGGTPHFVARLRARRPAVFTNAVVVLYLLTFTLGAAIYPSYRVDVRVVLEDMAVYAPVGAFELKEHFAALGLGLLPAYWYYWRQPGERALWARRLHVAFLTCSAWFGFVVGHLLNNLRGLGS